MASQVVRNQAEWDAIKRDFAGYIEIRNTAGVIEVGERKGWEVTATGSATVTAYDSAKVTATGSATVTAYDSATVTAYDSAKVTATGSATVTAYDSATVRAYASATVTAYDSATVRAYDSATVTAYDSATVTAYDSATVRAYDSATVTARANVQIVRLSERANLSVAGNARIVTPPNTAEEWVDYYGLAVKDGAVLAYKAVRDNLHSHYDNTFVYAIGETYKHDCPADRVSCGVGLHVAPLYWARMFGDNHMDQDFRIIEVSVPLDALVIPKYGDGKARTSELTVIREVPKEEWR
jgi:hypothetical protein